MDNNFIKISGTCSIIQSFLYLTAVGGIAFTPLIEIMGQDRIKGMDIFMNSYAANPWPVNIMSLAFILLGLIGFIGVAPATAIYFKEDENGWLKIGKYIGLLCLAVITVYYTWFLTTIIETAPLYKSHDAISRTVVASIYSPQQPSHWVSWFMFFGMGIWVTAVGAAAFRSRILPRGFVVVCAIKAAGFWTVHAGIITDTATIAIVGAITGGLIGGPLYHTWLGIAMRRSDLTQ
jgi:hypothetical protein